MVKSHIIYYSIIFIIIINFFFIWKIWQIQTFSKNIWFKLFSNSVFKCHKKIFMDKK